METAPVGGDSCHHADSTVHGGQLSLSDKTRLQWCTSCRQQSRNRHLQVGGSAQKGIVELSNIIYIRHPQCHRCTWPAASRCNVADIYRYKVNDASLEARQYASRHWSSRHVVINFTRLSSCSSQGWYYLQQVRILEVMYHENSYVYLGAYHSDAFNWNASYCHAEIGLRQSGPRLVGTRLIHQTSHCCLVLGLLYKMRWRGRPKYIIWQHFPVLKYDVSSWPDLVTVPISRVSTCPSAEYQHASWQSAGLLHLFSC